MFLQNGFRITSKDNDRSVEKQMILTLLLKNYAFVHRGRVKGFSVKAVNQQ